MNIAIFTDTYPPFINGVSTSCYNLCQVLKKHGHNVTVVTPRSDDGPLEYKDGIIYLPGFALKKLYDYRVPNLFPRKAFKILKTLNIDIIHNQTDFSVGIFARKAAKKLNVPIVYTYHTNYEDYTYIVTHGVLDRAAKKVVRIYSNGVAHNATEFITPSDKTKTFMRLAGNDLYINCIPTGIDFSIFEDKYFDLEKARAFKQEHGIAEKTKVVLILGRLAKEKSMDVSIRGYAAYLAKYPDSDTKMIVVGDGPARSELELLTHELHISKYVDFIGKKSAEEVPFYYHLADVYTSASLTETQGLTFMEAMAAGTTVLARYDDNLSGTIIDGKSGYFFTDENSFVNQLNRIFNSTDMEKENIRKGAFEILDFYSIERFYNNIIEVYYRAIKKYW